MALQTFPGQVGYKAFRYSSGDNEAMAKFTDKNHLENLIRRDGPTEYDRGVIDIWTQTSLESNDFLDMINKSEPFYVDSDTWSWEVRGTKQYTKITEIPTATANNPSLGVDQQSFDLVFDTNYFQVNDVITANYWHGDKLYITSGPHVHPAGYLYSVMLTGEDVTQLSTADPRYIQADIQYDKVDNVIGEFDQELSGLPGFAQKVRLYQSLSAGYGVEQQITSWADAASLKDSKGRPLDILVYDQYKRNSRSEVIYTGSRWEPLVERKMRDEMMKIRKHRMLYGAGGSANTLGRRQESKQISTGIIPQIMKYGNNVPFNAGDFSLNLFRDTFGDLFYRKVPMGQRRVKLYTNEAGMRLFEQANKDDLIGSGLTVIADSRFITGTGQNMMVNYGFNKTFTQETGVIEVSHLMELDLPDLNASIGTNKYSAPIFIAFDISNEGGALKNIREVRRKGEDTMTWGYIDGRRSHLGAAASRGMQSASMFPGYQIWMEDRSDLFIEDLSKTVIFWQMPQF